MGFFKKLFHIFRNKKDVAEELILDETKRWDLWQKHIENFSPRQELSENFSPEKIDIILSDFKRIRKILSQMDGLISFYIVIIDEEINLEKEIFADLSKLKSAMDYQELGAALVIDGNKQETILTLFKELSDIINTLKHLIRLANTNPPNLRDMLISIHDLISLREFRLIKPFMKEKYQEENKHLHEAVMNVAKAVLLQDEAEKRKLAEEKKMIELMQEGFEKIFSGQITTGIAHKLAFSVYDALRLKVHLGVREENNPLDQHEGAESEFVNRPEFIQLVKDTFLTVRKRPASDQMINAFVHLFREWYNSKEHSR